jgi:tetratricopeptide (TPR) repeat protein
MIVQEILDQTEDAIVKKRYSKAAALAGRLIEAGEPWSTSGYLYRGTAYENGDADLKGDLDKAISDYMQLALLSPTREPFLYLANAYMELGGDGYGRALRYLQEAEALGDSPGLDLGYAKYYEGLQPPALDLARRHFFRAAMAGRFQGFFGAARVLRKLGRPVSALFVDIARFALGPLIALLIGRRAQYRF